MAQKKEKDDATEKRKKWQHKLYDNRDMKDDRTEIGERECCRSQKEMTTQN